jgi:hypothetical protein
MRKILLLSILMSFGMVGYSQKIVSVSNPLEEYFQKNYDSTIFLYKSNNIKPLIYIISKKGDKLFNYTYTYFNSLSLSEQRLLDTSIQNVLVSNFNKTIPSNNQYLELFETDSISNIKFGKISLFDNGKKGDVDELYSPLWLKLQEFNLWSLMDDNNEKYRKSHNSISPNEIYKKDIFVLITKNQVRKLEYLNLNRPSYERDELRIKISEIIDWIWLSLTRVN